MIASSLLSDVIRPIMTSTSGREALGLMNDMNVNHLPIVNEDQLLGVISSNDILSNTVDEPIGSYGLMLKSAYLTDSDHLYEAMRLIGEHNLSLIPVVDVEKNYLGCITQDDLLRFFANIGSFTEPGSIIVLDMNKRDYSLAEISRIVEGESAAILSTFITTSLESEQVDVTLKINKQNIERILVAFDRYGFIIKASFQEEEYFESLKERYDALMSYLSV